jgi:SAM-dependent methyltransferase
MEAIAQQNYIIVADALERMMPIAGKRILDVGSAEGGFTDLMLRRGAECLGLEPDRAAAADALARNLPVNLTSFENFSDVDNQFDAIIFNDVFEHIQDPIFTLEKSIRLLKDQGVILINAPVSSGFIFKMVGAAARLGLDSPHRRIWAKGLPSPHIYFYNEKNLRALVTKYKFEYIQSGRLIALSVHGMYQRVRSTYGPIPALVISAIASTFVLISSLFPADVIYLLFRKNEKET